MCKPTMKLRRERSTGELSLKTRTDATLNTLQTDINSIIGTIAYEESALLSDRSKLEKRDNVHRVSWTDLSTDFTDEDLLLGKGSYCHVSKGKLLRSRPGVKKIPYFAIKCLKPQVMKVQKDFKGAFIAIASTPFFLGATDLAIEGEMLSRLEHKNIIKLHAISQSSAKTAYSESEQGYFLVLDVLEETLKDRLYSLKSKYGVSSDSNKGNNRASDILASIAHIAIG
ncbi:MAG: hypothetical protein SGARI_007311, partial [Bacillariaceae sp.]